MILLLVTIPVGNSEKLDNIYVLRFRGDYIVHALMFVPWAFVRPVKRISVFVWLLLGLVLAVGGEGIQYFIPYRAFNINDMVANVMGVLVGFVLAWVWKRVRVNL